jgi:hypothetical protein
VAFYRALRPRQLAGIPARLCLAGRKPPWRPVPPIKGENTMAVMAEVLLCVGYAVLAIAYLLHVLGS